MPLKQLGYDALSIQSNVFSIPITITLALVAKTIKCKKTSVYMDMYNRISPFLEDISMKMLAISNNLASVSSLLPKEKIWHQRLVSNIQPREQDLETLTYDDKHLIFFILSRIKVNLPITILNFMKKKIISSHEGIPFLIPFGRVLSELFHQEGIMKKVHDAGLTKALDTHWSLKLEVAEGTSGVGPFVP